MASVDNIVPSVFSDYETLDNGKGVFVARFEYTTPVLLSMMCPPKGGRTEEGGGRETGLSIVTVLMI